MNEALKEAYKAYKNNEIPVGAVIVHDKKIIARARNNRQNKNNVLGHAEVNAILKAEKKLKDWRLNECEMYVTLEPCEMCKIIIEESRLKSVYYLLEKPLKSSKTNCVDYIKANIRSESASDYKKMVQEFFQNLRN